jgi:hypothetical protein
MPDPARPAADNVSTLALDARVALAYSRVMKNAYFYRREAEHLAFSCGYHMHPAASVPHLISDDSILFMSWIEGWNWRQGESNPRTNAELLADLTAMNEKTLQSCAQHYELFAQRFTHNVDEWLASLNPEEQERALMLLTKFPYEPCSASIGFDDLPEHVGALTELCKQD